MKKNIKKYLSISALAAALAWFWPSTFAAADALQNGLNSSGLRGSFGSAGVAGSTDVPTLILNIVRILLYVAAGIAVLFLIIGGYWYITSAGSEEQAEKGRKTLINAIIGVIVIVLSYTIVAVISNSVQRSY